MARSRKRVEVEPPRGPGVLVRLLRLVETVAVLAVVAYVALLLMARTDGFRDLAEQYIESVLGMPAELKKARVDWRFDVILEGITAEGAASEHTPAIEAGRVELELALRDSLSRRRPVLERAILVDASADISATSTGAWEPAVAVPISAWVAKWLEVDIYEHAPAPAATNRAQAVTAEEPPRPTAKECDDWRRTELLVYNGRITWWERDSAEPLATVEGIRLDAANVNLSARFLRYYNLAFDRASTAEGVRIKDLRLEVIDADDQQLILSLQAERAGGGGAAGPQVPGLGRTLFEEEAPR
jgi:hypothetical protein